MKTYIISGNSGLAKLVTKENRGTYHKILLDGFEIYKSQNSVEAARLANEIFCRQRESYVGFQTTTSISPWTPIGTTWNSNEPRYNDSKPVSQTSVPG